MDNVVLVGSFVEVGCGSHLLPEAEFILLEVLVHVLYDGRRYVLAKEIEGFLPSLVMSYRVLLWLASLWTRPASSSSFKACWRVK